jgi:phage gpG-like protein
MSLKQRITDHNLKRLTSEIKDAKRLYCKVGFPENGEVGYPQRHSTGPVERKDLPDMSGVIKIAAIHEFGAPKVNVPERSFVRTTFDDNKDTLQEFKVKQWNLFLTGQIDGKTAIGRVGEFLVNKTKQKIRDGLFPPLKYREGTPLYDTGQLINSIQQVVVEEKPNE